MQLYEQEGSLCARVFRTATTLPNTVGSEGGSGYWCLFSLTTRPIITIINLSYEMTLC